MYILILSIRYNYTKSYPEITEDWITNTPKMAANVSENSSRRISVQQ